MLIWSLTPLIALLWFFFVAWLLIRYFLKGASLLAYDQPLLDRRVSSRDRASPEHQQTLDLLERTSAEIRAARRHSRKEWLATVRRILARGFCEPTLLNDENGYRIEAADVNGVPGEWVLAPHSDPDRRLLYLHGGSFISGCPAGYRVITTQLARVTGASVLALDYRLMPEHSRREMIADCQTAYHWLLAQGPTGAAPARELWIVGDSSGGNLALMLIAWARDVGLPAAKGAIALSPGADMTLSSPTLKSNLPTDPMLGPGLAWFLRIPQSIQLLIIWMMNRITPPNPLISPIYGDLSGLPPVLIQVSEAEMMLGDARRYVNKTRVAGSIAELETWPEVLHVWHLFEPLLPEAQEAFERIGQFVRRTGASAP